MPQMRAALLLPALLVACVAGGPARLTTDWPARPAGYDDAYATWTRKGAAYRGGDLALGVEATFLTPGWRAAYVSERARRGHLTETEASALRAKEQQASTEVWEFFVLAETHDYSVNDLSRRNRSMWTMTLIGPSGREVAPSTVRVDNRPRAELESWFPGIGPFHKPYVLTFPRLVDGQPVLAEGQPVRLKLGSALGTVDLRWN